MKPAYKISTITKVLSYIFPQRIAFSEGHGKSHVEVVVSNGKLLLNANQSNYSFGGLHLIFEQLFEKVELKKYEIKKVLLLGLGAGSVVQLLLDKHQLNCTIQGVELDPKVIAYAKAYFGIEAYKSLAIIEADAFSFTENCTEKFDMIVVDLFIGDTVPEIFASEKFIENLRRLAHENCFIAYNKMTDKPAHKKELASLSQKFDAVFPGWELYKIYAYGYENSLLCFNRLRLK